MSHGLFTVLTSIFSGRFISMCVDIKKAVPAQLMSATVFSCLEALLKVVAHITHGEANVETYRSFCDVFRGNRF